MLESERRQQITDCPVCKRDIPVTWFGKVNDVHFCDKCRLIKIVPKGKPGNKDTEKRVR